MAEVNLDRLVAEAIGLTWARCEALAEDLRSRLAAALPGSVGRGVMVRPGAPHLMRTKRGKLHGNVKIGNRLVNAGTVDWVSTVEIPFPWQFHEFGYMLQLRHRPGVRGKIKYMKARPIARQTVAAWKREARNG
jgi:hypothetical protein